MYWWHLYHFKIQTLRNLIHCTLFSDAWKSPINLTQDSHERVKRLLAEQNQNEPKSKKPRTQEHLEKLPDIVVCNEKPEQVPRILFSQIDNLEGLKNAVM